MIYFEGLLQLANENVLLCPPHLSLWEFRFTNGRNIVSNPQQNRLREENTNSNPQEWAIEQINEVRGIAVVLR